MLNSNFIPTTQNFDVQALYETDVSSAKFKELIIRLAVYVNQMSLNINSKVSGNYSTNEVVTGATMFPNPSLSSATSRKPTLRSIYSKVVEYGTLPSTTAAVGVPHGITFDANCSLVKIEGGATNAASTSMLPIPYASATLNENISVYLDSTNIYIKTGIDRSTYTKCNLTIYYLKN